MAQHNGRDSNSMSARLSDDDATDEQPFKRQKTSNGNGPTSTPMSNRRKTACQSCRLRKVKCDNQRPTCAICQSSRSECVYLDNAVEKLSLEAATQLLTQRLDQLQRSVDGLGVIVVDQGQVNQSIPVDPGLTHQLPLPQRHNEMSDPAIIEPSRDYLQIPPHRTTADTVLTWPIFDHKYPRNALIGVLFNEGHESDEARFLPSHDTFVVPNGLRPPEDERIPILIDTFLQNVHTKNPILDVEALVKHGRRFSEQGLGWDAWSCLVLMACALGSVAKPFDTAAPLPPMVRPESAPLLAAPPPSSATLFAKELQQAESCFVLACRRLGSLKHTMLGAQCHFFAGVYLMYTLRPLLSWQYFFHASILYQLYLKNSRGIMGTDLDMHEVPLHHLTGMSRKQRRLEQSLYWSCFKSECEFRVELPLPQSEIASYDYPNMFPEPPSPAVAEPVSAQISPNSIHDFSRPSYDARMHSLTRIDTTSTLTDEDLEIRQHSKRLCNEEESWYYYLTEVALRRIGNRIINTFFRQSFTSWLHIKPLLSIALEFDAQVSSWSAHLPPAMQHYETTSTIRAPRADPLIDGSNNFVSRELSWATDNRLLEMRSWLYQPFLYYLIHAAGSNPSNSTSVGNTSGTSLLSPATNFSAVTTSHTNSPHHAHHRGTIHDLLNHTAQPSPPTSIPLPIPLTHLPADDASALNHLIAAGIECNLKILDVRSLRHRHHGLWYDLRSTMTASLILLAIIKSGHADLIPAGLEPLFGPGVGPVSPALSASAAGVGGVGGVAAGAGVETAAASNGMGGSGSVGGGAGGKFRRVLDQMHFWQAESPDLLRHREVLERLIEEVGRECYWRAEGAMGGS